MRSLLEFIIQESKPKHIDLTKFGQIIFELDESSLSLLDNNDKQIITEGYILEMENNVDSTNKNYARILWTSKDNDLLKATSHAEDRLDRPVEKGGDGEHIDIQEIINMFIYSWNDILDLYREGHLKKDNLGNDKWVIQCKCYLEGSEQNLHPSGARPDNKFLWAVWQIYENYKTGKLNVKIITLFRGERLNHKRNQERIVIANNGYVKQKLPR